MTVRLRGLSLALAFLVLVPAVSAAQAVPSITFEIKGGVNSATIKSDTESGRRLGGVGGVFLGARITDTLGLRVEGLFSQRGATDETPGSDVMSRVKDLDAPVLLTLGTASDTGRRFHPFAGVQASYKLKAEASSELLGLTVDVSDDVEDLDFSAVVGAGVEMGRVRVDARYSHGLTNFAKKSGDTAKNRTIAVMVRLRLR